MRTARHASPGSPLLALAFAFAFASSAAVGCGSSTPVVAGPASLSGAGSAVASALARRAFFDFPDLPEILVQFHATSAATCDSLPLLIDLALSYAADGGLPTGTVPFVDLHAFALPDGGLQRPPLPFATFVLPELSGPNLVGNSGTVLVTSASPHRLTGQLSVSVGVGADAGTELTGSFDATACDGL